MNSQTKILNAKSGYVHARLTGAEQKRVEACAQARGLTVSKWVRETLVEALDSSPGERRLMSFIAAQTIAIRVSLEEWQAGKDLSKPDVQERIQRLAAEASREFMSQTKKAMSGNGEAA